MGATLASLGFGLYSLIRGGEFNQKHANQAMRWRILLQGAALLLFFLMLWLGKH